MTQNHKCLMRYKKPYVTQKTSAEYLLNKINMYPMLIPRHSNINNDEVPILIQ